MTTLKTIYKGNFRTEITHIQSGNKIITDAPLDNNGKGEYISPTDMLAASLGSCMMTIIALAADTHGFNVEGMEMEITKIMGTEPRRIAEIDIVINFPYDYTVKEKRFIEYAVKSCPVEKSIHPDIKRVITYNYKTN